MMQLQKLVLENKKTLYILEIKHIQQFLYKIILSFFFPTKSQLQEPRKGLHRPIPTKPTFQPHRQRT